jgi:hypothetical protein
MNWRLFLRAKVHRVKAKQPLGGTFAPGLSDFHAKGDGFSTRNEPYRVRDEYCLTAVDDDVVLRRAKKMASNRTVRPRRKRESKNHHGHRNGCDEKSRRQRGNGEFYGESLAVQYRQAV